MMMEGRREGLMQQPDGQNTEKGRISYHQELALDQALSAARWGNKDVERVEDKSQF